jgi:hypothetical protein
MAQAFFWVYAELAREDELEQAEIEDGISQNPSRSLPS